MPQCRAEVSKSHSIFLAALVRQAQIEDLHHDPGTQDFDLLECQMRRHLYHQLSFLDLKTAETAGPMAALFAEPSEVDMPLNLDDNFFQQGGFDTRHQSAQLDPTNQRWTSTTLSLIRYECYDVHRLIFREREQIRKGRSRLSQVSELINERRRYIEAKYLLNLDDNIPIQRYSRLVGRLLISRCTAMLLYIQVPAEGRSELQWSVRDQ